MQLAWAADPAHGYKLLQIEGYCSTKPAGGSGAQAVELVQYWSAARNDSFIVPVGSSDEATAKRANYIQKWTECYAAPPPPPPNCRAGTDCGGYAANAPI